MKNVRPTVFMLVLIFTFAFTSYAEQQPYQTHTENIIFVMTDGVRWQEAFTGADETLLNAIDGKTGELARVRYWRKTETERRETLMPFLWNIIAKEGQIFGNQSKGSAAKVTNGLNFSYPGYSETLCGFVDPSINSNNKIPNPSASVLEWLNEKDRFHGRIAAFGAWDLFPYILNRERSGFLINAGYEPMTDGRFTKRYTVLNQLKQEIIHYWPGEPFDALTFETAMEYLKTRKPRILYLSLGETDEWAHQGRYDMYLESAHRADACVKTIWETAQSMARYRGKTTLIFSVDHGRGNGPEWEDHGQKVQGAENIWMAFLGPDTPAKGEREQTEAVTETQIAATLAAFVGENYCAAVPKAGKPVGGVVATSEKVQ